MAKQSISLAFRLKKMDDARNYLLEEVKYNDLMSEKHKKACSALNSFEHFLIFISAVSGCVSVSASLLGVPVGITSSAVGIRFVQSLHELKSISQLSRKRGKRMIK